jgi:hypothetical protein
VADGSVSEARWASTDKRFGGTVPGPDDGVSAVVATADSLTIDACDFVIGGPVANGYYMLDLGDGTNPRVDTVISNSEFVFPDEQCDWNSGKVRPAPSYSCKLF